MAICSFFFLALGALFANASSLPPVENAIERRLVAATKSSALHHRSNRLEVVHSVDLSYAEGNFREDGSSLSSTVRLEADEAILILENIEHHLYGIDCAEGAITLSFSDTLDSSATQFELDKLNGGLVITSHFGCNAHEERKAFRVLGLEHLDSNTSTLLVRPAPWKTSFKSISLGMGYGHEHHIPRPHADLRKAKRQDSTSLSPTSTLPEATATVEATSTQLSIATQFLNTPIIEGDTETEGLGCKNCTTTGAFDLSWLNFDWVCDNATEVLSNLDDISQCLQGGEAAIVGSDLSAHVELYTNIYGNWDFVEPFLTIPSYLRFRVLNFASIGVAYQAAVSGGITYNNSINFTYGLDVSFPDPVDLTIDIPHPGTSSANGFTDLQTDVIPLQSSTQLVDELQAVLALRHRIIIDLQIGDEDADNNFSMDIGVYLDAPLIAANVTPVEPSETGCPMPEGSSNMTLYRIEPSAGFAVGLDGNYDVDVSVVPERLEPGDDFDVQIFNGTLSIDPVCLAFDSGSQTYSDYQHGGDDDQEGAASGRLVGVLGVRPSVQSLCLAVAVGLGLWM